jgi:sugar phosphate isomerase/epimerase
MRTLSVSTVVFEGYSLEIAFAEIAAQGFRWVEPAYIKGYMDFTEADFTEDNGRRVRAMMAQEGLDAVAISAHFDNGLPEAEAMLKRRLHFAAALGARYVITNSTSEDCRSRFLRNIEASLPLTEALDLVIALENPGHGKTDMMRTGEMARDVIKQINHENLRLNYDVGNALTCSEGAIRPEDDLLQALDVSCHMHLKDMQMENDSWRYVALGQGAIDYQTVLDRIARQTDCPLCIELPLRLIRKFHEAPSRGSEVLILDDIRSAISASADVVKAILGRQS